ncbi:MAG: thiamine biosynthesis protein ThiS [Candidatus Thorarchaeota archaeon]|nr:MAG: thiamine biosynthesis protein ThiS [Candidatus Thorarchaeota archaeon]
MTHRGVVTPVSDAIRKPGVNRVVMEESMMVSELLDKLNLSADHVVLVDGKQVQADFVLKKDDNVVVLPKIAGG